MTKKRKTYTADFKEEAVKLANAIGARTAAKDLGVSEAGIRKWMKSGTKVVDDENIDWEKEAKRLRKEIEYIKIINDVLKKSTAIFSQDKLPPFK